MMMSLRRLNELFPALSVGPASRDADIAGFAAKLRDELRRMAEELPVFRPERFCAQDFLTLFPPERRLAVLSGIAEYRDWRHAAAVRLARLIAGFGPADRQDALGDETAKWRRHPLIAGGSGALAFVRAALFEPDVRDPEVLLAEPPRWRGMTVGNFIAAGSTSQVYLVRYAGEMCALKLPRPGGEARFAREAALLKRWRHPHLPRLRAWSDEPPYCVIDRCRTGRAALKDADCGAALLDALAYLHGAGMVHGDIRWCNFGVDRSGTPVLLDFSHARIPKSPDEPAAESEKMRRLLA